MSGAGRDEDWSRSLALAAGFATAGATDEAVARALSVHRACKEALGSTAAGPGEERVMIQSYLDRAWAELGRLRALDAVTKADTKARSQTHYERERREAVSPTAGSTDPRR